MNKTCCKCKIQKDLIFFFKDSSRKDGYYHTCKSCYSDNKYPNKKKQIAKTGYKFCYQCNQEKLISEFTPAPSKYDGLSHSCRSCYNIKRRVYINNKYKEDTSFKIKRLLRKRLNDVMTNNYKSYSTLELLGCSIEDLKQHLQQTALDNNYKKFDINRYDSKNYHIDHIIPCSKFNLKCSYHQKLCFNYTNLQILDSNSNICKSDKIIS